MKIKTFLKPFLTGQVFLLVIFTVVSNGQTHIKDQIEIKPKQNLPDYLFMKPDTAKFVPFKYDKSMGRELMEERTLYRKVFQQPDGTRKARIYASPIHYKDEHGKFKNIMNQMQFLRSNQTIISSPNVITDRHSTQSKPGGWQILSDIFSNDYYLPIGNAEFIYGKVGTVMLCDNDDCVEWEYPIIDIRGVKAQTLIKIDFDALLSMGEIMDASLNVYLAACLYYHSSMRDFLCAKAAECSSNAPPLHEYCILGCPAGAPDAGARDQYISASIITNPTDWWDSNNYLPTYEDTTLFHVDSLGKMMTFDVLNAMERWKNGTIDNHGLILQSSHITDARRMFLTHKYGTYSPYLEVTYTDSVEPKLRIIEPDSTALGECILPYLDENLPSDQIYPIMPQVTCKAVFDGLSSLTTDPVDINWEYIVEYDFTRGSTYHRTGNYNFTGISQFNSSNDTTNWLVPFTDQNNDPKYIGGNITIIASTDIGGTTYSDTLINIYEILGQNPTPDIARLKAEELIANYNFTNKYNLIGIKYKIWTILYEESKFRQFEWQYPFFGYPEWGKPRGMGIGQLDNPEATPEQLWDWVDNLNAAINLFKKKIGSLNRYVEQVNTNDYNMYQEYHNQLWGYKERPLAPDFNTYQASINWHQLYNFGHYWAWAPMPNDPNNNGHWVPSPSLKQKIGIKRYNLELQITPPNPTYPVGWLIHKIGCQ